MTIYVSKRRRRNGSNRRTSITQAARVLYRAAFNGDTLPRAWHVYFVDRCPPLYNRSGWLGTCQHGLITVLRPSRRPPRTHSWLRTLVHEFVHQRCPGLRHGHEFERLISAAMERLWQGR